ncbi:TetR/AcrR family transcriptional regulator C-terminal domain-containing protein [Streptomyces sp. NPDC051921]|uniref:TetR/AcrR family transcriptional regulator C-terminal domain-containing protein n=1 Tax=Streptomyces sp. NPDC051921 TaxID=3155806 RepID=UPI00343A4E0A
MSTEPPYLRIASDIRRRIDDGTLSPGDPVPSTRQITADYGVAMATATKALGILKREELVRVVPGVGTVVADVRPAAAQAGAPTHLTKELIVATSVRIADVEGLGAVSMRRVAAELSSSSMALYRHVPGKGELVRLMSDAALEQQPPTPTAHGWRAQLEQSARWLWVLYGRHPWLVQTMGSFTRPLLAENAMKHTERVMRALSGMGLSQRSMIQIHITLLGYVQGIAMANELESQARQDTGMDSEAWMALQDSRVEAIQATGRIPILGSLLDHDEPDLDLDSLFEFGLCRVLDGIAVLLNEKSV